MATPVVMPKGGISVETCILTEWHKKKGDAVKVGDVLFTYETDKSTIDEEAQVDGIMLEQFFADGDEVECMVNVCVIGNEGESVDEFRPAGALQRLHPHPLPPQRKRPLPRPSQQPPLLPWQPPASS